MVNIGVLYSITAGVAAITIYIVLGRILATEHKELIDRKLVNLLTFFCSFCCVDMIWGFLTSRLFIINQLLYTIFTYAFHIGAALSAFLWAGYVIHYLKVDNKYRIVLNCIRGIVLFIQLFVLITNTKTNIFFYVDVDANYHSLKLRIFMFLMQFLYYVALILYSMILLVLKKHGGDKELLKKYKSALSFSCIPLAFGIGQMLWPDASMYSLGFMLTAVLIFSINVSSERELNLRTIYQNENNKLRDIVLGVSSDYQAIYYVNLEDNSYDEYGVSGEYKESIATKFVNSNDFFEDFKINGDKVILYEDRHDVYFLLSKEYMCSELISKKSYSFNYRLMFEDKEKYYLCKVIKVDVQFDGKGHVIIGVFDDDGRIVKENEQRKILEDALIAAKNSSMAKTSFLFNMSHDIRTPMNSIIGFTNLAKKHIDDKKYLDECLDKILLSSNHLLSLINDVLDMSRIESGKMMINNNPESIIMRNDQIISIVKELAIKKSITFNTNIIGVENEWIICDALHLNQILLNILSNAINYTSLGGRVDYTVEQKQIGDNKVSLTFTVKDTGIGMSEIFLKKIFDEFERENNSTASGVQGTGLGMSIVKRLVDMMGGTIDIQSTLGEGTTVVLQLDFEITDPVLMEENTKKMDYDIPSGRRVLLVDDNYLNREISVDLLEDLGVSCKEASDGRDAIEILKKYDPDYFDLVLMDIQMPEMNGYEVTKIIRGLKDSKISSIPIIAMTANAFEEDKLDAYKSGMNGHISKPIDISVLAKTLKEFL